MKDKFIANGGTSQEEFVRQWFASNPDRDISHIESKPAIEEAWLKLNGSRIEDADRAIRKLAEQGELTKIKNGVYRYNTQESPANESKVFSEFTRTSIMERDGFRCKVCGISSDQFRDLHIVPIVRFELGGTNSVSNGQVVCSFHKVIDNLLDNSKNISKSELKRLIDHLGPKGKIDIVDKHKFLRELLEIMENNSRNSHLPWKNLV